MQQSWQGQFNDEEQTASFGEQLARAAIPGDCIALVGEMGAGKTTLTRAMAQALGVDIREQFGSPTYTYANEYEGTRNVMVHIDLYRVHDEATALQLGLHDQVLREDAVVVVEWADKLAALMPSHVFWLRLHADEEVAAQRAWQASAPVDIGERLLGPFGERR